MTVEPRHNIEGPRKYQNLFATMRFHYLDVLFHIFYCYWSKENRSLNYCWEKGPPTTWKCKLVDFGESRADMIQTATVCSTQTTNIDKGTPVYMAPELLSTVDTSSSLEQLKACDLVVWCGYVHAA